VPSRAADEHCVNLAYHILDALYHVRDAVLVCIPSCPVKVIVPGIFHFDVRQARQDLGPWSPVGFDGDHSQPERNC
jgi:hypothetical protein